jgi:crotonobetainyl-CoA:carnitine CoA-transferase CaiB-like acyl-CoA transferase
MSNSTEKYTCPPELGADTDSVLTNILGYSTEKIEKLRDNNAIG